MVVEVKPVVQCGAALVAAEVDADVGPLLEERAVEPLDLAVGLGPVGPDALVADAIERGCEVLAGVVLGVVGQDSVDGVDSMGGEPGLGPLEEPGAGCPFSSSWISENASRL
jgi:hypothetical protein